MSDRPKRRMIEFIESYWTGGELGADYQWNDNHGELIRCKDCKWNSGTTEKPFCMMRSVPSLKDWFCADGEREET